MPPNEAHLKTGNLGFNNCDIFSAMTRIPRNLARPAAEAENANRLVSARLVRISPAEGAALETLRTKLGLASDPELIRYALRECAKVNGVRFPDHEKLKTRGVRTQCGSCRRKLNDVELKAQTPGRDEGGYAARKALCQSCLSKRPRPVADRER